MRIHWVSGGIALSLVAYMHGCGQSSPQVDVQGPAWDQLNKALKVVHERRSKRPAMDYAFLSKYPAKRGLEMAICGAYQPRAVRGVNPVTSDASRCAA